MSDDRHEADIDLVGKLIRRAGRRENPSQAEYDHVFAAASAALDRKLRSRRRRRAAVGLAAMAVSGMFVAFFLMHRPAPPVVTIATTDRMVGPAEVSTSEDADWSTIPDSGVELTANMRLRTGPASRLGTIMSNGVSLRLAEATEIRFIESGRIELVEGKIYADAGPEGGVRRIVIETGTGTTWDVGTQFEVRYAHQQYRLRVREGLVHLKQPMRELQSEAGEQLVIDAAHNVSFDRIARDDDDWLWTEAVAPDPSFDARPVSTLLEWVARQTGRRVEYARPELELQAATTILYGSVQFVEPLEALKTMLATTDFDYTLLENGTILIDSRQQ